MTTASYPGNIISFGPDKVNTVDLVIANDPNALRAEVVALETTIGVSPSVSTSASSTGAWYNDGRDYTTLIARLSNIETGIVADTHTQYVKNTGGSVITSSSASVVGLTVKGAPSQSANLQEWKNSSGTVVAYVDINGKFVTVGGNQLGFEENLLLGGM
jgi:hypothetical protein